MAWKKALFLGGAVLLLAACSDATAPSSLTRAGSKASDLSATSVNKSSLEEDATIFDSDCRSGYYVRSGDRDLCIEIPEVF